MKKLTKAQLAQLRFFGGLDRHAPRQRNAAFLSTARALAKRQAFAFIEHADPIIGRFSVLSPRGLAALCNGRG